MSINSAKPSSLAINFVKRIRRAVESGLLVFLPGGYESEAQSLGFDQDRVPGEGIFYMGEPLCDYMENLFVASAEHISCLEKLLRSSREQRQSEKSNRILADARRDDAIRQKDNVLIGIRKAKRESDSAFEELERLEEECADLRDDVKKGLAEQQRLGLRVEEAENGQKSSEAFSVDWKKYSDEVSRCRELELELRELKVEAGRNSNLLEGAKKRNRELEAACVSWKRYAVDEWMKCDEFRKIPEDQRADIVKVAESIVEIGHESITSGSDTCVDRINSTVGFVISEAERITNLRVHSSDRSFVNRLARTFDLLLAIARDRYSACKVLTAQKEKLEEEKLRRDKLIDSRVDVNVTTGEEGFWKSAMMGRPRI